MTIPPITPECRICGCTDNDCTKCVERTGEACFWHEEDLCSACLGRVVPVRVEVDFKDASGFAQKLSFETDIQAGMLEHVQLKDAYVRALSQNSFIKYTITNVKCTIHESFTP